jgi:Nucleotidyl transferase AbiEii toxin, Type IV TA system
MRSRSHQTFRERERERERGDLGTPLPMDGASPVSSRCGIDACSLAAVSNVWPDLPDPLAFDVYPIDEVAAEKLRCITQRVQCRDIYDLYRLTEEVNVSPAEIRPLFERKARARNIEPRTFADRFEDRVERYMKRWVRR